MRKCDEDKTSFTTPFGTYCFIKMPKGLRNAGGTFNKIVRVVLGTQLDRNVSAYVENVVVRSQKRGDHIQDLQKSFTNLRWHVLKLNLEKCVFGVRRGKFLACMISERGTKANPKNIKAIRRMKAPRTQREVQKLAGRLASLNRFISKSAERNLPFFKPLKGFGTFLWGPEQ
jgi:hypothetical protein